MKDLNERLDELKRLIQSQEFLEGKGLSNEVNIRIFCYEPEKEMTVRHFTEKLVSDKKLACHLKEYNLYRVFLSVCEDKRIIGRIPQLEEKRGANHVLKQLTGKSYKEAFIEKMKAELSDEDNVLLLTGVGESFPFIRVHDLLNAMQPHFGDKPILVMYPGTFDGRYVKLFDKLKSNPYYRAFNVI